MLTQQKKAPHILSSHVTKKRPLKATVEIKLTSGRPRGLSETSDLQKNLGDSGVVVQLFSHTRTNTIVKERRRDPVLHHHHNIQHQKSHCCLILKNETWISHLKFSTPHTKKYLYNCTSCALFWDVLFLLFQHFLQHFLWKCCFLWLLVLVELCVSCFKQSMLKRIKPLRKLGVGMH